MARRPAVALLLAAFVAAAPAAAQPAFLDVTAAAGLDVPHRLRRFENPYAEIMAGYTAIGAAAAVADFDGDGREDLFVTDSAADGRNHLYRNLGDWRFEDVAEEAGVAAGNDAKNASADALFLDYDDDGRPDLFVVRFGRHQLFHNEGGGRFREVSKAAGFDRYENGIAAIAFDYDRDGRLDLLVGNYFSPVDVFAPSTPRFFPESFETASNGGGVTLWRNQGPGAGGQVTFADATDRAGLRQSGWTLDVGAGDADNDGDLDLYVACDFGTDRFFENRGDGTFRDRTAAAIGYDTKKGMNAEWGDFDGDGWLDVYVTNITDDYLREGNFLWRNEGANAAGTRFADVAAETGTRDTGWGWGGKLFDYDNDGWLDLYVLNGWVSAGPESYVPDVFAMILRVNEQGGDFSDARDWPPMGKKSLSGYQKKKLFHNEGGALFSEQAARHGLDSTRDGRGLAVADFDADGRMDLFVANAGAPPHLYRNVSPPGPHWVELELLGAQGHREAIGAQVRLIAGGRTLLRFVDPGNGFAAQGTRRLHFGLGEARAVERVEVWWPSGRKQLLTGVAVDRVQRVVEGRDAVEPIAAAVVPAAAAAGHGAAGADCPAALDRFEAALAADADNLRKGSDYRRAVIACAAYDRAIDFFARLTAAHPRSANALLNHGYAYVDKIPAAGAVSQVILANSALALFDKALAVEESWLGLYTRGNSHLYWPKVFKRTPLAVTDLEKAVAKGDAEGNRPHHVRAWIALGDAHWKLDQLDQARAVWREGLRRFPGEERLEARLAREGEALAELIEASLDPGRRVDTDLAVLWAPPTAAPATPAAAAVPARAALRFVEAGAQAGVRLRHHTRQFSGPYADVLGMFTAGGAAVAAGDYDGDGLDDLFVTDSDTGRTSHLLHNEGAGPDGVPRFRDVTAEAGVGGGNEGNAIVADALWFDADADGRQDLLVARFGKPILYRNLGGGRFRDESAGSGLDAFANTIAAIAFDYDHDGRLDLLFGNYFEPVDLVALPDRRVLPDDLDQASNGGGVSLWRNLGVPAAGGGWVRFEDRTRAAGLAGHTGWTLDVGHADLDGDGWQDLYLAVDYGTDRLFWNERDGTFSDGTARALGIDTRKGMNVDVADYDRDGRLDVYVTNITDEYMRECNMLWHNDGVPPASAGEAPARPTFTDLSRETGTCDSRWGWAAKWADFDDDGWPDLFAANGLRSAGPESYVPVLVERIVRPGFDFSDLASYPPIGEMSWSGFQRKKLFHNLGGTSFAEVGAAAGVDNDRDGRGVAVADFDGDGGLDFFQTNAGQESLLYWNRTTPRGHWLALRLVGTRSNRDAIGARVTVRAGGLTQVHELDGGNGYASQSSKVLHFGLGGATRVDSVEIRWPSGAVETVSVPIDRTSTVREGSGVQP